MSEIESVQQSDEVVSRGFFNKLMKGDYGLSTTYWIFFVLIGNFIMGNLFDFIMEYTLPYGLNIILMLGYFASWIMVSIGV